jgi:general nucleoside transport system ATP-binding protein
VAILVISEELEELFDICDRIAVLAGGRLSPARLTGETNAEEIGRWMAGLFGDRAAQAGGGEPPGEAAPGPAAHV